MIGAIIGDIAGSRFEFAGFKSKDFELFDEACFFTDDTVMSLAIAKALMEAAPDMEDVEKLCIENMQAIGQYYPDCGYGGRFYHWIYSAHPKPYDSFGNGAAMRVSAVPYAARSLEEALELSDRVTGISHNHPEGLKGARSVVEAIWLARHGKSKEEIRKAMEKYYPMDFTLNEIRPFYRFNETSQDTVPQAIMAFLEAEDFEDAIRNAVSLGGDADTLAAITGSIAEAYFGVPEEMKNHALRFLDKRLLQVFEETESFNGTS